MSDDVFKTLIITVGASINAIVGALVVWSGKRTRNVVRETTKSVTSSVADVHTLVNDRSTKQDAKIDAQGQLIASQVKTIDALHQRLIPPETTDVQQPRIVSKEPEVGR